MLGAACARSSGRTLVEEHAVRRLQRCRRSERVSGRRSREDDATSDEAALLSLSHSQRARCSTLLHTRTEPPAHLRQPRPRPASPRRPLLLPVLLDQQHGSTRPARPATRRNHRQDFDLSSSDCTAPPGLPLALSRAHARCSLAALDVPGRITSQPRLELCVPFRPSLLLHPRADDILPAEPDRPSSASSEQLAQRLKRLLLLRLLLVREVRSSLSFLPLGQLY